MYPYCEGYWNFYNLTSCEKKQETYHIILRCKGNLIFISYIYGCIRNIQTLFLFDFDVTDKRGKCITQMGRVFGVRDVAMLRLSADPQTCFDQVRNLSPVANGMTWNFQNNKCFATVDAFKHEIQNCTHCISCIFKGTLMN